MEAERKVLITQIKDLKIDKENFISSREAIHEEISRVKTENKNLKKQVSDFISSREAVHEEISQVKTENKILKGHINDFLTSLEPINTEISRLKTENKNLDKILKSYESNNTFQFCNRDLSDFLANSLISPIIHAPFRDHDKRCFATMENITHYLTNLSEKEENTPLVSVILPVYNRMDIVKYSVDSVLKQSYSKLELIIVDDGSDDGTGELLENIDDPRVKILHNESCKGVSNARNRGLEAANGKYIAYLDSDNVWDSRYVAAMVGAFLELPDAEALYSGQLLFKGNQKHPFAVRFGSFNRSLLTNRNYIDLNAFCHTQDLYKRVGGFDETLIKLVDYDLILRMAETGQIYSVPVLLSHYYYNKAKNTITNIPGDFIEYLEIVRHKRRERISSENSGSKILVKNSPDHKVSVIIPNNESLKDIRKCVVTLLSMNISEWLEIIVVDNSSSPPVIDYLDQLEVEGKIKLIKNDTNYGFTYAINQGIDLVENGRDIVIMHNDAILTPGALEAMQKAAYELPDCGIVVPQQVLPADTKIINTHVPYASPKYECDVNLSAAHANIINLPVFHSGRVVELNFSPFVCVYIKYDVINSSLGLDSEFGGYYCSDCIFCNYVRHMMNLKIYYIEEAVVYHKLGKSTSIIGEKPDKDSNINLTFHKKQLNPDPKLGFKTPVWEFEAGD